MFKKLKFILLIILLYQTPIYSKSASFDKIDSKNISKYFSGIVALENKENSLALDFFNESKILINNHNTYLKKYISSLVLEKKVLKAINTIKQNSKSNNINFYDAYLLLIIDSVKKQDLNNAQAYLSYAINHFENDKFNLAILESLEEYIYVFKEQKFSKNKKNYGQLSIISETFQRCYLKDLKTNSSFLNLVNSNQGNMTRYTYFYLGYLINKDKIEEAKNITKDIEFINTTLLLSQGKSWVENGDLEKFEKYFSCSNYNDIISEFLFIISNLYSSEDNFERSYFYLNLSNYLNPKFIFNLSLVAENQFSNGEFKKAKKTLKNFKKEDDFFYWFRIKKEAQIIAKQRNKKESLNYITAEFEKIDNPNQKVLFDVANFYRRSGEYENAIKFYTKILNNINEDTQIKSDLLYRRGSCYERMKEYKKADKDLINSLDINPDDAYVLNYLAYSWLERNYKIDEAIKMLENAYTSESDDPYIIDSIGWAYFLVDDYIKAEKFLKRAVELMPDDPIVNDHYGDILWKLDRQIQARYFWTNVLRMDDVEKELLEKINIKIIKGL